MFRPWPALAVLCCGIAWGGRPSYSAAGIVNTGNYSPGPFAPNSILTIFGTELARSEYALTTADISGNMLPTELNYTRVYIDDSPVPLFYVSENQVNFLVPSRIGIGPAVVRVVREGLSGPKVTISIVEAAPALFLTPDGYAIASHAADYALVSPDSPARPGEVIIIWATGLGKTASNPNTGEIPVYLSEITKKADLQVLLDGQPVNSAEILYAGLAYYAGLYQINLRLPDTLAADSELRVAIGSQSTPAGLKLAVQ